MLDLVVTPLLLVIVPLLIKRIYRGFVIVWALRGTKPHQRAQILTALGPLVSPPVLPWQRLPPGNDSS